MNNPPLPPHISPFTDPAFYPHKTGSIVMLQTHISWVFLAGAFAYKIKKPVNLGFLDFTSLQQRHTACLKELQLNRRLAPGIYLSVLPITRQPDGYRLNGETTAIDYCLKMVRFDQQDLFDRQITQRTFNPIWMDQLAGKIAAFHAGAEPSGADARSRLILHIDANFQAAASHPQTGLAGSWLVQLTQQTHDTLNRLAPLLIQRQQNGRIRDGHGDLHLKNITLFKGEPTPFDCIEFNDAFRTIDTMNDAAFLIMDCDARERPDLGVRFLSRYLEQTGDYEGLSLLPLYLSYRAGVRGKVACLLADDPGTPDEERSQHLNAAADYFRLAARYLNKKTPTLFAVGGLSGSGKSHLSLLGMAAEHALIIRTDATRKRIAANHAELPLYGEAMHKLTYQTMLNDARTALQAGYSVILDATFLHPGARAATAALAAELAIPLTFYWLDIAADTQRERIKSRSHSGEDISDADLQVLEQQLAGHTMPEEPFITPLRTSNRWP